MGSRAHAEQGQNDSEHGSGAKPSCFERSKYGGECCRASLTTTRPEAPRKAPYKERERESGELDVAADAPQRGGPQ